MVTLTLPGNNRPVQDTDIPARGRLDMPTRKRWHPVSRGPETKIRKLWALTEQFGSRSLRLWLEILRPHRSSRESLESQWRLGRHAVKKVPSLRKESVRSDCLAH